MVKLFEITILYNSVTIATSVAEADFIRHRHANIMSLYCYLHFATIIGDFEDTKNTNDKKKIIIGKIFYFNVIIKIITGNFMISTY